MPIKKVIRTIGRKTQNRMAGSNNNSVMAETEWNLNWNPNYEPNCRISLQKHMGYICYPVITRNTVPVNGILICNKGPYAD